MTFVLVKRYKLLTFATLAILLAGCSTVPGQTVPKQEAFRRVGAELDTVRTAVPVPAEAQWERLPDVDDSGSCMNGGTGSLKGDFSGQARALSEFEATLGEHSEQFISEVRDWWLDRGFPVEGEDRFSVSTEKDGYRFYVTFYQGSGKTIMGGVSPCVWENGSPDSG